jgi:phosphoglucosamine mutase
MKNLFGTDGMRGRAGEFPLDATTVEVVGRSLTRQIAEAIGKAPRFVTGRDTRESGDWIEAAFHRGVFAEGGRCESAGVITTPGVAYLTREFALDAGIVISASHNPYFDNGIKIFSPTGKKIAAGVERAIEREIAEGGFEPAPDVRVDEANSELYADRYEDYLISGFPGLDLRSKRIVIDCANGAASALAPHLFARLGAAVVAINDRPDGRNINHECGSLHLDVLRQRVLEENADLGVAFDGDADRALFVDELGETVDGDAVLWIMAKLLSDHGRLENGAIVATVMSNLGLEVALATRNIRLLRTSVGDKYVLEELMRTRSAVGGEQSGHIIFPERSLVGDGMMTALFVLEAIFEKGTTLSAITDGFTRYPQTLVNVKVREKRPFADVAQISAAAREVEARLGDGGRLLLRYSGTENLARVMIEGRDQQTIEREARGLADIIGAALG